MLILSKRSEFLAAARARRQGSKGMMVQGRNRGDDGGIRVGFTCSKKVGNAVKRNRAKRRLRAIVRDILPDMGHAGWDYVLIGRARATANRDYVDLSNDLKSALTITHGPAK